MALTRLYKHGTLADQGFPIVKCSDYLSEPDAVVWFDLCEPTAADLSAVSEELGLHPLAVEDAVAEHQRAKLDRYQSHLFVTSYQVKLDTTSGELRTFSPLGTAGVADLAAGAGAEGAADLAAGGAL